MSVLSIGHGLRQIIDTEPVTGDDVIPRMTFALAKGGGFIMIELRMTEHTRIVIDNVVFDEDPSKSELV